MHRYLFAPSMLSARKALAAAAVFIRHFIAELRGRVQEIPA